MIKLPEKSAHLLFWTNLLVKPEPAPPNVLVCMCIVNVGFAIRVRVVMSCFIFYLFVIS